MKTNQVKNSIPMSTPDCESVNLPARLVQNNSLLPKKIGHETVGDRSPIEGNIHHSEENEQGISNVDGSGVVGNNLSGSDNNVSSLTSRIETSYGVVIGRDVNNSTINIYQCPKELTEVLIKLMKK
jgi:hypothetical protein